MAKKTSLDSLPYSLSIYCGNIHGQSSRTYDIDDNLYLSRRKKEKKKPGTQKDWRFPFL